MKLQKPSIPMKDKNIKFCMQNILFCQLFLDLLYQRIYFLHPPKIPFSPKSSLFLPLPFSLSPDFCLSLTEKSHLFACPSVLTVLIVLLFSRANHSSIFDYNQAPTKRRLSCFFFPRMHKNERLNYNTSEETSDKQDIFTMCRL